MTESNKFDSLEYSNLLSDIYKQAKSFKVRQKPAKLEPLSKSPTTSQNMLLIKSPYKKLENSSRRAFVDLLSLTPDALSFVKNLQHLDRGQFQLNCRTSRLRPEVKLEASASKLSKTLKTSALASSPSPGYQKTSPLRQKYQINLQDLRLAMKNIRKEDPDSRAMSKYRSQKDLCAVLRTLERQCDISNDLNSSGEIESQLTGSRKVVKNWTERLNWTASKIEQLSHFDDSVKKKLYKHDLYTNCVQKIEAISLQKDLQSKSVNSLRNQAKLIKKVLIRKKLKIL